MKNKNKYYVVWVGKNPGIYNSWSKCQTQISGTHSKYMGFASKAEAEFAFSRNYTEYYGQKGKRKVISEEAKLKHGTPLGEAIAVDAAFNGKTKKMEYQGVFVETYTLLFHFGPISGATNNIGEFLALVHALAYQEKNKLNYPIYTDSKTAMSWFRNKKCKTQAIVSPKIADLVKRGENWLITHDISKFKILKWETNVWGEIPADFGRK